MNYIAMHAHRTHVRFHARSGPLKVLGDADEFLRIRNRFIDDRQFRLSPQQFEPRHGDQQQRVVERGRLLRLSRRPGLPGGERFEVDVRR